MPPLRLPRGFTPEALADIRHRYVATEETLESIAKDYGVHRKTLRKLAKQQEWPARPNSVARDVPSDLQLALDAENLVLSETQEGGVSILSVANRLQLAIEKELRGLELSRAALGREPMTPVDAERRARILQRITEAMIKIHRIHYPDSAAHSHVAYDEIFDIDAFRIDLARRITEFVHSHTGGRVSSPSEQQVSDQASCGQPQTAQLLR